MDKFKSSRRLVSPGVGASGEWPLINVGAQKTTECYECTHKPIPKSFPVCTIRSTPSQPIHCIVWAKSYLFMYVRVFMGFISLL